MPLFSMKTQLSVMVLCCGYSDLCDQKTMHIEKEEEDKTESGGQVQAGLDINTMLAMGVS